MRRKLTINLTRGVAILVRVHMHSLAMNIQSMNTTTKHSILSAAGVSRRSAKVNNSHPQVFYDVAHLNSTGRGYIETCRDAKAKLLHCRQNLKIATFNV